jgi:hypothetical protein
LTLSVPSSARREIKRIVFAWLIGVGLGVGLGIGVGVGVKPFEIVKGGLPPLQETSRSNETIHASWQNTTEWGKRDFEPFAVPGVFLR